jgi:hypothetical protein
MLNTRTAHSELPQSTNSLRICTSTGHKFSKKISDSEEKSFGKNEIVCEMVKSRKKDKDQNLTINE